MPQIQVGCVEKGLKKARQKPVSIFINCALGAAGVVVGGILGLVFVSLVCAIFKGAWIAITGAIKK